MKSRIRDNIIANEKIVHGGKIEAKKLYDIIEYIGINKQNIADMFQLNNLGKSKAARREGKVIVRLYNVFELQDIRKEIREKLQNEPKIDGETVKRIQNYYKLGDKEIRILFNISLYQLKKLKENEKYTIKNKNQKLIPKEIFEKYKYKAYLYTKDVKEIKNKYNYTIAQIAKIFDLTIETVRTLEKGITKRTRIYLYTREDKEIIIKESENIIKKQRATLEKLDEIIENQPYDKEIILEILGINQIQYKLLKEEKTKVVGVSNYEQKQKVQLCLLDIENLHGYGRREYQKSELENILTYYGLSLKEWIEYADKNRIIREMYEQSLVHNGKVQINQKVRMSNQFFEENLQEIQRWTKYIVINFCIAYRCFQEYDDYIQNIYEFLLTEGGGIVENMQHDKENCIKILCCKAKSRLFKQYAERPKDLGISIYCKGEEIGEDRNQNLIDNRFLPEELLEQKEEIEEIYRIIIRNIKANIDFAIENEKDFFRTLAFELQIEEDEMEDLRRKIQLIILQNNLVKQDKKGRIIKVSY